MQEEVIESKKEQQRSDEQTASRQPAEQEPSKAPTPAELDELRQKAANADKYYDQMLRIQANLENYRKRAAREREEIVHRANEHLFKELFAVLDHFEKGLQSARDTHNKDALQEGMEMVYSQFQSLLTKLGVEIIEGKGHTFDPSIHEAIAHQESEEPAGKIIAQTRKGYRLKGYLLRPAAVVVSKGKS